MWRILNPWWWTDREAWQRQQIRSRDWPNRLSFDERKAICLAEVAKQGPLEIHYSDYDDIRENIQAVADRLLIYFDDMPSVPIRLVDEHTSSGSFYGMGWIIKIRTDLLHSCTQEQLVRLVLHEMTHAWVDYNLLVDDDHGKAFQAKAAQLGLS